MNEPHDAQIPEPAGIKDAMPEAPWSLPNSDQSPYAGPVNDAPGWASAQDQPTTWTTAPNTWAYTPYQPAPSRSVGTSRAVRAGIGLAIAATLVAIRFIVFDAISASSSNSNASTDPAPSAISASVTDLNLCISTGQPLLTMLNALSGNDSATQATAVQTAITQEQQIADPLPAGSDKSKILTTISELQTLHTDMAAEDYAAETTDIQTLSTDTDGIMASCG